MTAVPDSPVADGLVDIGVGHGHMTPGDARRTIRTVYLASFATSGLNQLFMVLLFFLLSPSGVGLVNWGMAFGVIAFYVLDLGVSTTLVVTAKQEPIALRTMVGVVSAFRLVAAALVATIWLVGTSLHLLGSVESVVLLLVLLAFMLRELQTPFICWLQVLDRQATVAVLGLLPMVVRLTLLLVLWRLRMVTVESVLVASLVGDGLGLIAMGGIAARFGGAPEGAIQPWRLAVKLLRAAPMLTVSQAILVMQSRFDWLLVAVFASYSALANYAIANKATELLVLSGAVFGRNALPWLVTGWSHPGVGGTVRWLSVGVNFAALGLALFGWPILQLVFKAKYEGAAPVIPVLAALSPALTLYQVLQFTLLAKQRTSTVVLASGLALAVQIGIDVVAVPVMGIIGAAIGMCGFTAVAFPIALRYALKFGLVTRQTAVELGLAAAVLPIALLVFLGISRL